jgi:hypothetical protein
MRDLWISLGQSNLNGRGSAILNPHQAGDANDHLDAVQYYWSNNSAETQLQTSGGDWIAMAPKVSPDRFGFEMTFAREMANMGRSVSIFKVGRGGSDLAIDWLPPLGDMYLRFKSEWQAALATHPGAFTFRGFIWIQGEGDANNAGKAAAYQANMGTLFTQIRSDLSAPSAKVIYNQLHTDSNGSEKATVRAGQAAYEGTDANAIMVNLDDLDHDAPGAHFLSQGYVDMGPRMTRYWHSGIVIRASIVNGREMNTPAGWEQTEEIDDWVSLYPAGRNNGRVVHAQIASERPGLDGAWLCFGDNDDLVSLQTIATAGDVWTIADLRADVGVVATEFKTNWVDKRAAAVGEIVTLNVDMPGLVHPDTLESTTVIPT